MQFTCTSQLRQSLHKVKYRKMWSVGADLNSMDLISVIIFSLAQAHQPTADSFGSLLVRIRGISVFLSNPLSTPKKTDETCPPHQRIPSHRDACSESCIRTRQGRKQDILDVTGSDPDVIVPAFLTRSDSPEHSCRNAARLADVACHSILGLAGGLAGWRPDWFAK